MPQRRPQDARDSLSFCSHTRQGSRISLSSFAPRDKRSIYEQLGSRKSEPFLSAVCHRPYDKMEDSQGNRSRSEAKRREPVSSSFAFFHRSTAEFDTLNDQHGQKEGRKPVSLPKIPQDDVPSSGEFPRPQIPESGIAKKISQKQNKANGNVPPSCDSVKEGETLMGEDFEPGKWHVVCRHLSVACMFWLV